MKRNGKARRGALTVREAYQKILIPGVLDLAPRTVAKYRHVANSWERETSNPTIDRLTTADFVQYRTSMHAKGKSPWTIENTLSDVLSLLRFCRDAGIIKEVPSPGRRLKRRILPKDTPTPAEVGKLYQACDLVEWPVARWRSRSSGIAPSTPDWWRGVLCMVYLAGFRRGDCLTLRWCDIKDDRIVRVMAKTRFVAEVPIHPILRRHLSALPRVDEFVFGHHGSNVQVDLWFRRLSQSAGLDKRITFQALRRCAGRVWEKARPRAGSAILGHKIRGSDGHYLDEFEILTAAMPCVEIPIPMLEPNVKQPSRTEILRALQGMDRGDVLAVVHAASTLLATGANGATTGLDGRRAIELLPEPKRLTGPGASNDRRGSFNW